VPAPLGCPAILSISFFPDVAFADAAMRCVVPGLTPSTTVLPMAIPKAQVSTEAITAIRQQYADGVVLREIVKEHDVTKETVCYFVDGGARSPEPQFPPLPRRVTKPRAKSIEDSGPARRLFVKRLWRTAAAQVQDIQNRLDSLGHKSFDSDVRALAVLVKTLRELAAFDETHLAAKTRTDSDDDDYGPRDINDFRRELARKMDALVARRTARNDSERESGTD
jgi:hypothetical protein